SSTIDRWARNGHLHQLLRGVYAVGHSRITRERRWLAGVLPRRGDAVLSFGAAGQSRGIVSPHQRQAVHVTVPRRSGADPDGVVVHLSGNIDRRDVSAHRALPTTTATLTVWDLATAMSPLGTRRAFEQAEKLRLLDRERVGGGAAGGGSTRAGGGHGEWGRRTERGPE